MLSPNVILEDVSLELKSAMDNHGPMKSAHDGWAVLYEEVDELWDLVKVKQRLHDHNRMYEECIQIAAMAVRFAHDICNNRSE